MLNEHDGRSVAYEESSRHCGGRGSRWRVNGTEKDRLSEPDRFICSRVSVVKHRQLGAGCALDARSLGQ